LIEYLLQRFEEREAPFKYVALYTSQINRLVVLQSAVRSCGSLPSAFSKIKLTQLAFDFGCCQFKLSLAKSLFFKEHQRSRPSQPRLLPDVQYSTLVW
jgi:hypothetical protein